MARIHCKEDEHAVKLEEPSDDDFDSCTEDIKPSQTSPRRVKRERSTRPCSQRASNSEESDDGDDDVETKPKIEELDVKPYIKREDGAIKKEESFEVTLDEPTPSQHSDLGEPALASGADARLGEEQSIPPSPRHDDASSDASTSSARTEETLVGLTPLGEDSSPIAKEPVEIAPPSHHTQPRDPTPFPDNTEAIEAAHDDASPRPRKRRRLFMDAVELPAPRYSVQRKTITPAGEASVGSRAVSDAEFKKALGKIQNPKAKKRRANGITLNRQSLKKRLQPIGLEVYPTGLDKAITDTYFSRYFISRIWGGMPAAVFPRISKFLLEQHGLDDWMCLTLDHNPYAPQIPGAPGLYFIPGHEKNGYKPFAKPMRLLVRIDKNEWQYMGQYELKPSKWMTKEEWDAQSTKCRNSWASEIVVPSLRRDWPLHLQAEVYLLKTLSRQPTWDEVKAEAEARKNRKTSYTGLGITASDVHSAFAEGLTPIGVYTMKCVSYDRKFIKEVCEKLREQEEADTGVRKRYSRTGREVGIGKESVRKRRKGKTG